MDEVQAELARLRAENERLKKRQASSPWLNGPF